MKKTTLICFRRLAALGMLMALTLGLVTGCGTSREPGLSGGGFAPGNTSQAVQTPANSTPADNGEPSATSPTPAPAPQATPVPTAPPAPSFDIVENTENDALNDVIFLLYDDLSGITAEAIDSIAPAEYWRLAQQTDPNATPEVLAKNFRALMEDRQAEFDNHWKNNPYANDFTTMSKIYPVSVTAHTWYEVEKLQSELNQKYGIPVQSVKEAATVTAGFSFFRGKHSDDGSASRIEFTVVRIGNRWYLYDRGMFYPELIRAVCGTPGGFNYLMDAGWLEE